MSEAFEKWWGSSDKATGSSRGYKEAAWAGWQARQKQDAEICYAMEADEYYGVGAAECFKRIKSE